MKFPEFTENNCSSQKTHKIKKCSERKKKDDVRQEDFVCFCKKKYRSYAALYTHIKKKHNGKIEG